jgi:hypothetical protein
LTLLPEEYAFQPQAIWRVAVAWGHDKPRSCQPNSPLVSRSNQRDACRCNEQFSHNRGQHRSNERVPNVSLQNSLPVRCGIGKSGFWLVEAQNKTPQSQEPFGIGVSSTGRARSCVAASENAPVLCCADPSEPRAISNARVTLFAADVAMIPSSIENPKDREDGCLSGTIH